MTPRLAFEQTAEVAGRVAFFLDTVRPLLRQAEAERERGLRALQGRWESLADGGMARLVSEVGEALRAARSAGAFANPWRIAGVKRREVPIAAVLAWFLSPDGDHGAGDTFLHAFWREATAAPFPLTNARCTTELVSLADAANRIDLVLEGDDCVVFVEVKVDAPFQRDQLVRYLGSLERRRTQARKQHSKLLLVGNLAPPPGVDCTWVPWSVVARALCDGAVQISSNTYAARLARDFAAHLQAL